MYVRACVCVFLSSIYAMVAFNTPFRSDLANQLIALMYPIVRRGSVRKDRAVCRCAWFACGVLCNLFNYFDH